MFGATFVPSILNAQPIYRGIQVQKIIQKLDMATNLATGPAIKSATVGEKGVQFSSISNSTDIFSYGDNSNYNS